MKLNNPFWKHDRPTNLLKVLALPVTLPLLAVLGGWVLFERIGESSKPMKLNI